MFTAYEKCLNVLSSCPRAKLAEWLTCKGKALKRPAMTTAAPPKTNAYSKPEDAVKSQPPAHTEPQPAVQREPETHRGGSDSAAAHGTDTTAAEVAAHGSTPLIMNTTLDLLENSDVDLPVDPQTRVDDVSSRGFSVLAGLKMLPFIVTPLLFCIYFAPQIVVNLCDALEAMATPSRYEDGTL